MASLELECERKRAVEDARTQFFDDVSLSEVFALLFNRGVRCGIRVARKYLEEKEHEVP